MEVCLLTMNMMTIGFPHNACYLSSIIAFISERYLDGMQNIFFSRPAKRAVNGSYKIENRKLRLFVGEVKEVKDIHSLVKKKA